MAEPLRCVEPDSLILGWDFSTGAVKLLVFTVDGRAIDHNAYLKTDLWTEGGVSELSLPQLEGQAVRSMHIVAWDGWYYGGLDKYVAGGISATHHTSGRLAHRDPIRRAICWNDQTLAKYHAAGLERLGGQDRVRELIGGPWAERYSLTHLLKDEETLTRAEWKATTDILSHGSLAAYYLTDQISVSISSAASTGLMDLRTNRWRLEMLGALAGKYGSHPIETILGTTPIVDGSQPIGPVKTMFADPQIQPKNLLIFPTLDDQAAGLVGGGATDAGHVAIILGNSAVVNSSADFIPEHTNLDVMKLNWGPFLWMRCYSNGAQFLDKVVGAKPDWPALEKAASDVPAGCDGTRVLPFALSEPSLGVKQPRVEWLPKQPESVGVRVRASFEALAYLIALAVKEHEAAGQQITRVSVSGGIAKSDLMVSILASVLNKPLERLESDEGPALGAAVAALAGLESHRRKEQGIAEPYTIADAVRQMVRFKSTVQPNAEWVPVYAKGLEVFRQSIA